MSGFQNVPQTRTPDIVIFCLISKLRFGFTGKPLNVLPGARHISAVVYELWTNSAFFPSSNRLQPSDLRKKIKRGSSHVFPTQPRYKAYASVSTAAVFLNRLYKGYFSNKHTLHDALSVGTSEALLCIV